MYGKNKGGGGDVKIGGNIFYVVFFQMMYLMNFLKSQLMIYD